MYAQGTRVSSALIAIAIMWSGICTAQAQTLAGTGLPTTAQSRSPRGRVMSPASSIARPGDAGVRAHTHLQVFVPEDVVPFFGPPVAGLGFETPASLACIYSLVPRTSSCNPNVVTANASGGFGAIALVDAFHYPTALTDLQPLSALFQYLFSALGSILITMKFLH